MPDSEREVLLFTQLVSMFHLSALQQMGKLKNPATDKVERELDQAQLSIDILEMLRKKTLGNLGPEEERMIRNVLQELKLNYVDEVAKGPSPAAPEGPSS